MGAGRSRLLIVQRPRYLLSLVDGANGSIIVLRNVCSSGPTGTGRVGGSASCEFSTSRQSSLQSSY